MHQKVVGRNASLSRIAVFVVNQLGSSVVQVA